MATHVRFPEDISDPVIIFHAKKWEKNILRKSVSSRTVLEESYKKSSLGSVSLFLPDFQEKHEVEWDEAQEPMTILANAGAALIGGLSGQIITDYIKVNRAIAVSQDSIATFKDVANRVFTFSFTLIPKSEKESETIKLIIDFFRYNSLPEYSNILIDFPSIFDVAILGIKSKNGVDYFNFKPMALTGLDVTYGENGIMQLMSDNRPTKVRIDLSFREVTKPYKKDFEYFDSVYSVDTPGRPNSFEKR